MNYVEYALKYKLVEKEEDIPSIRYACYVGERAIEKLCEHKNQQYYPRILPRRSSPERSIPERNVPRTTNEVTETAGAILIRGIENHSYDGVRVEELVKMNIKPLGEQVMILQEILELSSRKRCLDQQMEYTLPAFTEKQVSISSEELVEIRFVLPEVTPLRRSDIEDTLSTTFKSKNYDIDEVISGLIQYKFI
jgi:hypothetical protein